MTLSLVSCSKKNVFFRTGPIKLRVARTPLRQTLGAAALVLADDPSLEGLAAARAFAPGPCRRPPAGLRRRVRLGEPRRRRRRPAAPTESLAWVTAVAARAANDTFVRGLQICCGNWRRDKPGAAPMSVMVVSRSARDSPVARTQREYRWPRASAAAAAEEDICTGNVGS